MNQQKFQLHVHVHEHLPSDVSCTLYAFVKFVNATTVYSSMYMYAVHITEVCGIYLRTVYNVYS